ncbi:dienelactone hydrolase family protein [Lacipirellula sp.]|uniref:dienelactone hydrolase family protein n=1 Tax=Lacipirellula sp. TaxID=2691419 RepID=UPI003D0CC544
MILRPCYALIVTAIVASAAPAHAANIADFVDFSLRTPRGNVVMPGRLYAPPEASPAHPVPLVVYLHGSGASGTNNTLQIEQTPDMLAAEAKRRGAMLYVPQTNLGWTGTSVTDWVMTMIDRAVNELRADPHRLYVTGYSMGGGGTWNMLSRYPGRFAAGLVVSPALQGTDFKAANLTDTPIIAVHARDDATTPVSNSRNVVNQILAAAGEPAPTYPTAQSSKYFLAANLAVPFHQEIVYSEPPGSTTNYFISRPDLDLMYYEQPTGDHTGVLGVYYSEGIYDWMFSHALPAPEPSSFVLLAFCGAAIGGRRRGWISQA